MPLDFIIASVKIQGTESRNRLTKLVGFSFENKPNMKKNKQTTIFSKLNSTLTITEPMMFIPAVCCQCLLLGVSHAEPANDDMRNDILYIVTGSSLFSVGNSSQLFHYTSSIHF